MGESKSKFQDMCWRRDEYIISTDPSLIPIAALNAVFATNMVYWANPLPDSVMRETLENSLSLGLYRFSGANDRIEGRSPVKDDQLVGFARCITDFTTFIFLTDVYVLPEAQGKGLGAWLMECVKEAVEQMPFLRRSMLFTSDWDRSVPFYEKTLDMTVVECSKNHDGGARRPAAVMQRLGPGFPTSLLK